MLQRNPALNRRRDLNPKQNITKTATQFKNKSNYAAVFLLHFLIRIMNSFIYYTFVSEDTPKHISFSSNNKTMWYPVAIHWYIFTPSFLDETELGFPHTAIISSNFLPFNVPNLTNLLCKAFPGVFTTAFVIAYQIKPPIIGRTQIYQKSPISFYLLTIKKCDHRSSRTKNANSDSRQTNSAGKNASLQQQNRNLHFYQIQFVAKKAL